MELILISGIQGLLPHAYMFIQIDGRGMLHTAVVALNKAFLPRAGMSMGAVKMVIVTQMSV